MTEDNNFITSQIMRNTFGEELEKKTGKKVRNVFYLCRGINDKDYFVFQGNGNSILGILETNNCITDFPTNRRWV